MSARGTASKWDRVAGGFVDDGCPPLGDLLVGFGIDAASFEEWLGPQLGNYRVSCVAGGAMPTREAEVALIEQLGASLAAARRQLDAAPGPRGDAAVSHAAMQVGLDWGALTKRLRRDLSLAQGLLGAAAPRVRKWPVKRGRKPSLARAELLRAVIARLRATPMSAESAQRLAELLLIRCRVPVPASQRAVRRAAKVTGQK